MSIKSMWPCQLISHHSCIWQLLLCSYDVSKNEIKHSTVCPTGRTKRLHDTIVGPTSRTDRSVRRSYRVNAQSVLLFHLGLGLCLEAPRDSLHRGGLDLGSWDLRSCCWSWNLVLNQLFVSKADQFLLSVLKFVYTLHNFNGAPTAIRLRTIYLQTQRFLFQQ